MRGPSGRKATNRANGVGTVLHIPGFGRRRVLSRYRQIDVADRSIHRIAPALNDRVLERGRKLPFELHARQILPRRLVRRWRLLGHDRSRQHACRCGGKS